MTDYISREDAVKALRTIKNCVKLFEDSIEECAVTLDAIAKSADVRPVVRAHWTDHRTFEHNGEWYCSACGKEITIYMGPNRDDRYSFCPNCGADLREES